MNTAHPVSVPWINFFSAIAGIVAIISMVFGCLSSKADERPNFVLFFIDDLKPMTRDYGYQHNGVQNTVSLG